MVKKQAKTTLSVDFDYWVVDDPIYDFGHKEAPLFLQALWMIRLSSSLARDKDLRNIIKIDDKEITIDDFIYLIKQKKKPKLAISESHESAYTEFENTSDLHIVNVDAHHDLGYGSDRLNCDNWLWKLIEKGVVKKVTQIYPHWRNRLNLHEGNLQAKIDETRKTGAEVEVIYGVENLPKLSFDSIFLCRSGAWVPPWLDDGFTELMLGLFTKCGSTTLYGYNNLSEFDRKIDEEAINKMAATEKEMLQKFIKEMNKNES